jgi:hypothetical protein
MPVSPAAGGTLHVPRQQLRCLVRLPRFLPPQDGVIDTGAPLTCFPKEVWERFAEGRDYEWLPFEAGFVPPLGQMVGWRYSFRVARFLVPLALTDLSVEVERPDVIAAFADGDPPDRRGQAVPLFVVGPWGGLLEGGAIHVARDAATGRVRGELAFA